MSEKICVMDAYVTINDVKGGLEVVIGKKYTDEEYVAYAGDGLYEQLRDAGVIDESS